MSSEQSNIDQTITLLKIQALLASAYELSVSTNDVSSRMDPKFLSYLIKMARMEVRTCFDKVDPVRSKAEKRNNLDRM